MPLPRLKSKSKNTAASLSPSNGFVSSTPRIFLPPSHYAAAAGITYQGSGQKTANLHLQPDSSTFIPEPYGSEAYSLQYNSSANSRSSNISQELPSGHPSIKEQRRLGSIPSLEAHLLPSLRDTIDRMTKSPTPSPAVLPSPPTSQSYKSSQCTNPSPIDSPMIPRGAVSHPSPSHASHNHNSSPFAFQSASTAFKPIVSDIPSGSFIVNGTPPMSNGKLKPKPILKSNLRPPTPKFSGSVNAQSSYQNQSLRSSRAASGQKSTMQDPVLSPPADAQRASGMNNSKTDGRKPRARSRTDPGSTPTYSSASVRPKLLSTTIQPKTDASQHRSIVDDSDLENRYERDTRDRRKLMITNAIVVPSSSSESDVEIPTPSRGTRLPVLKANSLYSSHSTLDDSEQRPIGLGLTRVVQTQKAKPTVSFREDLESDDSSVYTEEGDPVYDVPARTSVISTVSSEGGEVRKRRKEALIGIMDGLGFEGGTGQSFSFNNEYSIEGRRDRPESEYYGEEGLAVSWSGDIDQDAVLTANHERLNRGRRQEDYVPVKELSLNREEQSEENQHHGRRSSRGAKRMSTTSSFLPRVVISNEGNHQELTQDAFESSRAGQRARDLGRPQYLTSRDHGETRQTKVGDASRNGRKLQPPSPIVRQNPSPKRPQSSDYHLSYNEAHSIMHSTDDDRYKRFEYSHRKLEQDKHSKPSHAIKESRASPPQHTYAGKSGFNKTEMSRQSSHKAADLYRTDSQKSYTSDAASLAESTYAAAAREREAFGIPPSASDLPPYGLEDGEIEEEQRDAIPHAESDLSSVHVSWKADLEPLSTGAQALFRKLSVGENRRHSRIGKSRAPNDNEEQLGESSSRRVPIESPRSQRSSISSLDSEDLSLQGQHDQDPYTRSPEIDSDNFKSRTWRSQLSPSTYRTLLDRHGETELQRQEVIWELCKTEREFVNRLHSIIQLFIQPLRVQHSKSWIMGVPKEVTRLFDWLEDIVNLHSQISSVLQTVVSDKSPLVDLISDALRNFVPRFEIYQPYLIRFEEVTVMIEQLATLRDGECDFGEFVRIQENRKECEGWTLRRFLVEPVNRLAKYPHIFQRLSALTPQNHPDFLSTVSLRHATDTVFDIMAEVKIREDEYAFIKDICESIDGLPHSIQLARRERRLLHHGLWRWISADSQKPHIRNRSNSHSVNLSHRARVYVLVFTDIIVLMSPISSRGGRPGSSKRFLLLEDIGITRVLGYHTHADASNEQETTMTFNLLPIRLQELDSGTIPDNAQVETVTLSLPENISQSANDNPTDQPSSRIQWLSAFGKCSQFTLRSLSFPSHSGKYLVHGPNVDLENDTRESIMSILATGLPLPKSPSVQIEEVALCEAAGDEEQEREERGWWSLRFQQVLRETRRKTLLATTSSLRNSESTNNQTATTRLPRVSLDQLFLKS